MTSSTATIVAAVDGSSASLRAVAYAAGLARRERARLICLHVRQPATLARIAAVLSPDATAVAWADPRPGEFVSPAVAVECRSWDATARLIVRLGDPFTELTALATEVRADVIVTGAPGSLLGRVLPTLPSRVLRRRQWPVVIIPLDRDATVLWHQDALGLQEVAEGLHTALTADA